jgi:two-component sensor histidine kinase
MLNTLRIYEELKETLEPTAAKKITEILGTIYEELRNTVTKEDFRELKGVILDLAEAQKRTEQKVEELAEAQKRTEQKVEELAEAQKKTEQRLDSLALRVEELAEAQKKTEQRLDSLALRVEELAEAQKKTEQRLDSLALRVEELAEAQKKTEIEVAKLAKGLQETRGELGGLSRSMSYAFENEAFRKLPDFLKEKFGIEIKEKLIREDIGGKEINIFGIARRNGAEVYVVGESKLRLDERKDKRVKEVFEELENKVKAVKAEYGDKDIVKILITHYATKGFLNRAKEKGIIVIQSFEW